MVIGLGNRVGGEYLEQEKEKQNVMLRGIVCWEQIVLVGLDKVWEGSGGIVRHLLKCLDVESEGLEFFTAVIYTYI